MAETFIALDCESNGLHGQIFAMGATLWVNGEEVAAYLAACPIRATVDPWVKENVPAYLLDFATPYPPERRGTLQWFQNSEELRNCWTMLYRMTNQPLVVTDTPWPVEARFLWDAHKAHPFSGPYPLLDVESMRRARPGVDTLFANPAPHDPLEDARVTAHEYMILIGEANGPRGL